MLAPNITSMFKWVNTFFSGVTNQSQDYLQLARASDGTVIGWIDEAGVPRGSLAIPAQLPPDFVGDAGTGGTAGLVPAPQAGSAAANEFLSANGSFEKVPSPAFVGDSGSGGVAGLVPAPPAGSAAANEFLSANGSFEKVSAPNFVGDSGSGGVAGLVPAPLAGSAAAGDFLSANGSFEKVSASSSGVRFLKGSGGDPYITASGTFVDVDDTNLKTTITVPVGYLLVVTANGSGTTLVVGINIDGSVANYVGLDNEFVIPFSVAASLVGDGNSHTVTLQFEVYAGGEAEIVNNASNNVPTMTLVLLPSI